ncbi:MAG: hypothetical protein LQ337_005451 [Flavoplaca oasis]|nr:MAG: hypothetical protein LQ337_005451 [Flavoplaca oasis]
MRVLPLETHPVGPTSILVTAVDALTAIGLRDYTAQSSPQEMRFQTPAWSEVTVNVIPKPPTVNILNQLATLCIYYGVANMAEYNEFVEAKFECLWDNVNVADVHVRRKRPGPAVDITPSPIDSTEILTEAIQTQFSYIEDSQPIPTIIAFITAMNAIKSFSLKGPNEIMIGSLFTDPGPHWDASIIYPDGSGHRPIRRQPPFLKYRYALMSMRPALLFMLQHRRFAEIVFLFIVDGVRLGDALLIKGKPDRMANTVEPSVSTA